MKIDRKKWIREKNSNWHGNKVGLDAIHARMRQIVPRPLLCEKCKKKKSYHLANVGHKYNEKNLKEWKWLCNKCHMIMDGRLQTLVFWAKTRIRKPVIKNCIVCKKNKRHDSLGMCSKCFERVRYYRKRRTKQTVSELKNFSLEESIRKVKKIWG